MEVGLNSFANCSVWNKILVEDGYIHHIVSLRDFSRGNLVYFLLISNSCGIITRYLATAKKFIVCLAKRKTFFTQNTYQYVKKYTISE